MESFIDRITEETDENFRICRENIPNFETTISPLLNTMKNIKLLLDDAAFDQQKLENNCEETCMNCTKSQLNDFLGIKVEASTIVDVKSQLVPQSKESSALVETNEPNEQGLSSKPKENDIRIVPQITDEEFKTIPKYQLGRLTLEMMNEIVSKMDDFLMKKSKILGKTNKQLTRSDREVLDNWRELEMKARKRLPTTLFFIETDIRPMLQDRLRPSLPKQFRAFVTFVEFEKNDADR